MLSRQEDPSGQGSSRDGEAPTVREVLARAAAFLKERGVPTPRLDAELLLAHVLGTPRYLFALEPERTLSRGEDSRFRELVRRRGEREPVQYILGSQEFWSLDFPVDRRVLIPRPETELVVEKALEAAGEFGPTPLLIDMGCGCGTMAVVLARELPEAAVLALDISFEAASCALEASARHVVSDRVMVAVSDMFTAVGREVRADIIVSNPPYIDSAEIDSLQPEVSRYEPRRALDGGPGGLGVIARLVRDAERHLRAGGLLIFEAGAGQAGEIADIVASVGAWESHQVLADLAGHPRVHVLRRK